MVEAVTVYMAGGRSFTSVAEAKAYEAEMIVRPLVESGPFVSADLGIKWLSDNAAEIVAILRPSVPKAARDPNAPKRRGRRSKAQIAADNAAAATQTVSDDIEESLAA